VAPPEVERSDTEIAAAVAFHERFFKTQLIR
jgi:hypothetical protein